LVRLHQVFTLGSRIPAGSTFYLRNGSARPRSGDHHFSQLEVAQAKLETMALGNIPSVPSDSPRSNGCGVRNCFSAGVDRSAPEVGRNMYWDPIVG